MSKSDSTTTNASPAPDAATPEQKLLQRQRERARRTLLKRRQRKSHQ